MDQELVDALKTLKAFASKGSGSGGAISAVLHASGVPDVGKKASTAGELAGIANRIGNYQMVTGGSQMDRLGTNATHFFGANTAIVADLESMVEGSIKGIGKSVWNYFSGKAQSDDSWWDSGGDLKQVYGNKTMMVYGQNFNVHRGMSYVVHQPTFLGGHQIDVQEKRHYLATEFTIQVSVQTIAILILLLDIAMIIAIKVLMEMPPKHDEEKERKEELEPWAKTIDTMVSFSSIVESVLLGKEAELEKMHAMICLLYTSPSPRDLSTSRMPSSA